MIIEINKTSGGMLGIPTKSHGNIILKPGINEITEKVYIDIFDSVNKRIDLKVKKNDNASKKISEKITKDTGIEEKEEKQEGTITTKRGRPKGVDVS